MRTGLPQILALLLVLLALQGCKDGIVAPDRFGTIRGRVVDFETGAPIGGSGITTSPATDATVTDGEGVFSVTDALVGSYTITANRNGYTPNTATVSVREGRETTATVFLRPVDPDIDPVDSTVVFAAEVLNFTNETFQTDSSYVNVEYRALNNGETVVRSYEVYFRIDTDRGPFYQEIRGTNLGAGQRDFGSFRKYLIGATATAVVVEDTSADKVR